MPRNRNESFCERKNARHLGSNVRSTHSAMSESNRMQRQGQRTPMLFFLFTFAIMLYICTSGLNGGDDGLFQCVFSAQLAHALVPPNAVRRRTLSQIIGNERITKLQRNMATSRTITFLPATPQDRDPLQSNNSVESGREHFDIRMSTTAIPGTSGDTESNAKSTRRWFLATAGSTTGAVAVASALPLSYSIASAASIGADVDEQSGSERTATTDPVTRVFEYTEENQTAITVPLMFTGQELLIAYKVDGSKFKAVLDTGSPFLMIPGSCGSNTRQKSGCYQNQGKPVPKLTPTIEIFDGFEGEVNWRSAPFEFWDVNNNESINATIDNASGSSVPLLQTQQQIISTERPSNDHSNQSKDVIFGVASEAIMGGPGGVFFGMIRDTDARIRPSFLGQTDVRSFRVNLDTRPRTLTLSNRDLIAFDNGISSSTQAGSDGTETAAVDYIPMTNLLRRRYGDPVGHYTACAQSIYVNGFPLVDTKIDRNSKILVIFDTGVTGMVVSRGLFDEQYILARKRREKTLFGDVELTFSTALGGVTTLRAAKPLATPFDPEQTWKKFPKRREGKKNSVHIIVMGLAFLEGRSLTVDIDGERIWVK